MAVAAVTLLLDALLINGIHPFPLPEVERELMQLQNEVELMKGFLKDLANNWETLALFERDIREIAYEAQDFIDYSLMQFQVETSWNKWMIRMKRLSLAKGLSTFRGQRLRPLLHRLQMASVDASATTSQQPNARVSITQIEEYVVGFKEEASTLIKWIHEKTEELDIISVVGMAGVGKTTLARKIYRKISNGFPFVIWMDSPDFFDRRDVLLFILRQITGEDMSELPDALLADIVRKNLEKLKFLMVIDDVHTTEDWRCIETVLPKSNRKGKVLLTTRDQRVAWQVLNPNREPHPLRFLSFDESWELLQLKVFGRNNSCPPEFERMGKQIVEQCGGLPNAVVAIGEILTQQCSDMKGLWEKVSENVSEYLQDDRQREMEKRISLSYNKLPPHLRDCFLYLGMFPRDSEIPAWKLTRLWIAEGFIQQNRGKSLEEVAGDYLNDLVARNSVIVGKTKANGDVKTCRVHDTVRDFCQREAAFAYKNLFREVKMTRTRGEVFDPAVSDIEQHRRLCIHSNVIEFLSQQPKGPRIRSFVCFSKESIYLPEEYTQLIPEAFDLLRVLDVNPIKFHKFPSKLTKLIHLRYIALSGNEFRALPRAVSKLSNLQTITIDTTSHQFKIRADIWKMTRLRHLKTKAAIVLNEEAEGTGGESLQTLSRLSPQSLTDGLCDRAFNLKNLGVRGDLNTLTGTTCLARLDRLQKLKLIHDVFPLIASAHPLIGLPRRGAFPPNLRVLELSSTYLLWNRISILGTLPTLEILKLKSNAFTGISWAVDDGCFPSLEILQIQHSDLMFWAASEDSFPRLKNVVLKDCLRLERIPLVLRSIQVLSMERVNKSAVETAMNFEKEMQDTFYMEKRESARKFDKGKQKSARKMEKEKQESARKFDKGRNFEREMQESARKMEKGMRERARNFEKEMQENARKIEMEMRENAGKFEKEMQDKFGKDRRESGRKFKEKQEQKIYKRGGFKLIVAQVHEP